MRARRARFGNGNSSFPGIFARSGNSAGLSKTNPGEIPGIIKMNSENIHGVGFVFAFSENFKLSIANLNP